MSFDKFSLSLGQASLRAARPSRIVGDILGCFQHLNSRLQRSARIGNWCLTVVTVLESRFWEGTSFSWDCSVTGAIQMNNHIQKSLLFYKLEIWAIRWKEIFTVIFLRSWSHGEWHILVFFKEIPWNPWNYLEKNENTLKIMNETTSKTMKILWKIMKTNQKPCNYLEKPTHGHVLTDKQENTIRVVIL